MNRDDLRVHLQELTESNEPSEEAKTAACEELLAPIDSQEVWAAGVTYFSSRLARMEESRDAGGGDFYSRVYEADRPELFSCKTGMEFINSRCMRSTRSSSFIADSRPIRHCLGPASSTDLIRTARVSCSSSDN